MADNEREELAAIWSLAAAKLLDVRRNEMKAGDQLYGYRLPAAGFLFGSRGKAKLLLDGRLHADGSGWLLHGAKGMTLDVEAEEDFQYFFVFYRAMLAFPGWRRLRQRLESGSPFNEAYGFKSADPLPLLRRFSEMTAAWERAGGLGRLEAKGLFYQLVHEVLRQSDTLQETPSHGDPIGRAILFLQERYADSLSLEDVAARFGYSPRHLTLRFRERTGTSPIDYLIRIRLERARELLTQTSASLPDIAAAVGYADVYYFGRLFRKHAGLSPIRYRTLHARGVQPDRPSTITGLSIGGRTPSSYSVNDSENHYHKKREGGGFIQMRKSTGTGWAMVLLLGLTLLLSACGQGNSNGGAARESADARPTQTAVASTAAASKDAASEAKTRTVHTSKGDIEVPAQPERVVVLYMQGDLLALGVKPVGTSDVEGGAAFASEIGDAKTLGNWFEPNMEAVLALDPDLIVVPSEETYELLHKVAPTVLVPAFEMTTPERLKFIGGIFGKEKDAEALLADFDSKVAAGKEKLKAAGLADKTVTIVEGGLKQMSVVESKQFGRGSQIIYDYLGLKAPEVVQKKIDVAVEAAGESVSMEALPAYVGDFLFRSVWDGADDMSGSKVWTSLPAVQEGRLIEIGFGFSYYGDIYSLDKQLDFVVEKMLEAGADK
ncbi:helix-turn-helix domain-containing protein [Cohnella sp. GCM10012308]|uniref:helix-turn-helix domain-containing protein n=1 Tax=Cohnella sp. GCM10012308 TaxID=3317329 RepID=UPI003612FD70